MNQKNNELEKIAKVLVFNENLGEGIALVYSTGEKIRFSYREIEGIDGFKILFPGDVVKVIQKGKKKKILKVYESQIRTD